MVSLITSRLLWANRNLSIALCQDILFTYLAVWLLGLVFIRH